VYSPQGTGAASERSRLLLALLKAKDMHFLVKYAARVRQQVQAGSPLAGFLCSTTVLVPVPGSAPLGAPPSVADYLASALIGEGLGQRVWRGLRRTCYVRKSATAAPGLRPTVGNHYDSFVLEASAAIPPQIVLVDDVVTKGRTLLAAAARLQEAFPHSSVRAFALVRTMGLIEGVERLLDPCVGEIRWRAGDAHRIP